MDLDERKQRILQAVINSYVDTAEPVGSRTIARHFGLGVSPATIRNEMADLEELGYLEQPHTSAGRIPSDKGYRFYVDFLLSFRHLADQEMNQVQEWYASRTREIDWLFHQTARILSQMTRYPSLVLGPRFDWSNYRYLQMLPLNHQSAILVLVTATGVVEHALIELPLGITETETEKITQILNDKLRGLTLDEVRSAMLQDLNMAFSHHVSQYHLMQSLLNQFAEVVERTYQNKPEERVYLGGTTNILNQPEFRDVDKAKTILGLLEEEEMLHRLLTNSGSGGVAVSIGQENKCSEIQNCSMVTARYEIGGKEVGTLGIIGPTRMDYGRVIAIMELVTQNLSQALAKTGYR